MLRSKKPPVARKFSEDGPFELNFERNCDLTLAIFCGEDWGGRAYWLLDAIHTHVCAQMTHQPQLRARYRITIIVRRLLSEKEQKQVSIKRFLKRNIAHVGMAQCINALADKVQKQDVPCTQWYTLHNMATLFNNHPYIISSQLALNLLLLM